MYKKEEHIKKGELAKVNQNETIDHTGDLIIEGDVEENACINVREGSLSILGNVMDGAQINVSISDEMRNAFSVPKLSSVIFGGAGATITVGGVTSCNLRMNNILIGNVNIDNRIFTNDQVTELGNKKYKISPANESYGDLNIDLGSFFSAVGRGRTNKKMESVKELATAEIDGIKYQGKEILVVGSTVWVDGEQKLGSPLTKLVSKKPQEAPKLVIHGDVGNVVVIRSDAEMEIKGKTGNFCHIKSKHAGLRATDIGEDTKISVYKNISVSSVEKHCVLTSAQYGLDAVNINNNVTVNVRDAINVTENIGNGCDITSHQYGLTARNIGDAVTVKVRDTIKVRNIGSASSLTSAQYGLDGNDIGDNVSIHVRDAISLNSIGNDCDIESKHYGIDINEMVGANGIIKVRENINVGCIGHYSQLISSHGKIKISGNSGHTITVKARDSIHAKDVGINSTIISSHDEVNVRNVGSKSTITARTDIDIDGSCPTNVTTTSYRGKVRRAAPKKSTDFDAEVQCKSNNYKKDLDYAIALSNAELLKKQGTFSKATEKHKENEVEKHTEKDVELQIPEAYICVITQEIMVKPVICSLDGRTYEASAIKEWLTANRTSPCNRKAMKPGQNIDDVLFENRNLEDAIELFRAENRQLFGENSNTP